MHDIELVHLKMTDGEQCMRWMTKPRLNQQLNTQGHLRDTNMTLVFFFS